MAYFRFTSRTAGALLASTLLAGCAGTEQQTYEKAIMQASVRGPGWDSPLTPLPPGYVSVSTFTDEATLDVSTPYVWVATTDEVWRRCKDRRNVVLALEQLLGLPPLKNPRPGHSWHFFVFEVESQDLVRPCPGGVESDAQGTPKCRLISDLDPKLDAEYTQFLLQQWWLSHRATTEAGRDPELGYPWTGMGWTYDWDPASRTHRGVSEFVVRKTAVVRHVRSMGAAEFCAAGAAPRDQLGASE